MNWDAIGAVAELLGAIGVIASLIYLASQIRANARSTNIETELTLNEAWNATMAEWGSNEQIADVLGRGFEDFDSLSQPEKAVFQARIGRVLNHHYTQNRMRRLNVGDPELVDAIDGVAAMILKSPGGAQWWNQVGRTYAHFEEVEELRSVRLDVPAMSEMAFWKRGTS